MLDKLPFSLNTSAGAYPTSSLLIFGSDYGHADFVTPMARFAFYEPYGVSQATGSPIVFIRMGGTFQSGLVNGYSESTNIFGTPDGSAGGGQIAFSYNTVKGGINALYKQLASGSATASGFLQSAGLSGKAQYEFMTRKVLNTFQQLIYQGPSFRRFTLPFTMKPTSVEEAKKMIDIIKTFRIASSPKGNDNTSLTLTGSAAASVANNSTQTNDQIAADTITGFSVDDLAKLFGGAAGPQNLTFGYPDMCKFQIVLQQVTTQGGATDIGLAEVFGSGYCVIENVQVDYGSQNKMVFFTPDAGTPGVYYPSEINLSISLRETSLPLAGDIKADHSNEKRTIF
jgi:hypothetical protein